MAGASASRVTRTQARVARSSSRFKSKRVCACCRLNIAVDFGLAMNSDGMSLQIEGGAFQTPSWPLLESANIVRMRMAGAGWDDHSILHFPDVPLINVQLMPAGNALSSGAGEATLGPHCRGHRQRSARPARRARARTAAAARMHRARHGSRNSFFSTQTTT